MTEPSAPHQRRRILVVEDEPFTAALIDTALTSGGFEVHTSASAQQARHDVEKFDPDAAVLDISLGRGPNGVDLAHVLYRQHPGVALLLLTKHPDLRTAGLSEADLPPNCGFMRKESVTDTANLLEAVEGVLADQADRTRQDQDRSGPLSRLTPTQVDVLRMVAQGYTSPAIAEMRGTSTSAVEKMLGSIYEVLEIDTDLGISPRSEAMRIFIAHAGLPERT